MKTAAASVMMRAMRLIAPRDTEALANAIQRLSSDTVLYKKLATAGRKRVEERFAIAATIREFLSLVMSANGNGRGVNRERQQSVDL